MTILDTSFVVKFLRSKPDGRSALDGLKTLLKLEEPIGTDVIVLGEIEVGLNLAQKDYQSRERDTFNNLVDDLDFILPISKNDAKYYGIIKANLTQQGELIGDNDTWIAANCLSNEAKLATYNRQHFEKVLGLELVDLSSLK